MKISNYIKLLDKWYKSAKEETLCTTPDNKIEFLGNYVFDFYTYDPELDEEFARCMLEVLGAIIKRKTYEYINDRANYLNYITMVNMPFLRNRLEWGTSIRGAWLDIHLLHNEPKDKSYWINGYQVPKTDFKKLCRAIIDWSKY